MSSRAAAEVIYPLLMIETSECVIRVHSRRQAMEWSLVLASQGIEASILAPAEDLGWRLVLDAADSTRALQALRQYRVENRGHVWVHKLPGTELVFDFSSLVWVVVLALIYWIDLAEAHHLRTVGLMDNQAVQAGQWWRLFTAVMLHGDFAHLASNLATGFLLMGLAMGTLGPGLGLLGAYLAGVCGNVAGLLLYSTPHLGLGASGMVLGALGLLTAQSLVFWRGGVSGKQLILRALLGGLMLLVLLGFNPSPHVDVIAHVAGFLSGIVFGAIIILLPERIRRSHWTNRLAVVVCTGLVMVTWWLALR